MNAYCSLPFTHVYNDSYGVMMPCCYAAVDHPYHKPYEDATFPAPMISDGFLAFHQSDAMRKLRLEMLKPGGPTDYVKDVCRKCVMLEERGLPSARDPMNYSSTGRVMSIKLRLFGNTCNLQCFMCNIKNSSNRIRQTEKMMEFNPEVGQMLHYDDLSDELKANDGFDLSVAEPETFSKCIDDLKSIAHKIYQITIIGGEPFILPSHYKVLDAFIECGEAKNIILRYDSNLTKLHWSGCHIENYIKHFKQCNISFSLDGYGKYNDYIRFPSKWDEVISNYNEVKEYAKVNISTTLTALSVLHLDELYQWIGDLPVQWNNVHTPEIAMIENLHPTIRKRLANKYQGTGLNFLCDELSKDVLDWENKWEKFTAYLEAIDHVNRTDYKSVFPELCNLS
jgi:sulfatase maturation enzyme AslB (radical SAM superfamily)